MADIHILSEPEPEPEPEPEVTICQHCGDEGFTNAFVYCVKCLNFAVHRYCLHKFPPTFDEFVYWACEDCEQMEKSRKTSLLQKPEAIMLNKEDNISPKYADCKKKSKKESDAMSLDAEKVEKKKENPPSREILESPTTPMESEVKNSTTDISDSQTKENESKTSQTPNRKPKRKRKRKKRYFLSRMKKRRKVVVSSVVNKGDKEHTKADTSKLAEMVSNSSPIEEELKKKDGSSEGISVTNTMTMDVDLEVDNQAVIEEMPSGPVCIGKRVEEPKVEKERRFVVFDGGCEVSQVVKGRNHARPVINPVWRGNFITGNKKYDMEDGFVAHLSCIACPKIWAEVDLFPHSLCLEMLPKTDLWPESFQVTPPTDYNIALYFFPADKSKEKVFDQLVEKLMCKEAGMRSMIQNAELLVFPSMDLPLANWRFKGKYYLWGVFRAKQPNPSSPANQLSPTNNGTHKETNIANIKGHMNRVVTPR